MSQSSHFSPSTEPTASDVVLGGRSPQAPVSGVVLGGLAGVKQRLSSPDPQQRIAALAEALNYPPTGQEWVMGALGDRSEGVQQAAYALLKDRPDPAVQQAVRLYVISSAKRRFASDRLPLRLAALEDVIHHGHEGLNFVIHALRDPSDEVQQTAYRLLKDRPERRVRKALELFSSTGVNYMHLRALLITRKWQQADQETLRLMIRACGFEGNTFQPAQIQAIPCEDLLIIDRLWTRHSNGRFGFSVQRSLWNDFYNLYWSKSDTWSAFGDRVGWRVNHFLNPNHWKRYDELSFHLRAPVGHLPFLGDKFGIFTVEAIANQLTACQTHLRSTPSP